MDVNLITNSVDDIINNPIKKLRQYSDDVRKIYT